MNALYWKIDFLHKQCLAFAAAKERKLLEGYHIKRLYIGTDRQDYMVNWSNSADKRNVMLHASAVLITRQGMYMVFTLTLILTSTRG